MKKAFLHLFWPVTLFVLLAYASAVVITCAWVYFGIKGSVDFLHALIGCAFTNFVVMVIVIIPWVLLDLMIQFAVGHELSERQRSFANFLLAIPRAMTRTRL